MKYIRVFLLLFLLSSPVYSADWPTASPSSAESVTLQKSGEDYFTVKTWREEGEVWLEVEPVDTYTGGNILFCNTSFSVTQNTNQYLNIFITNQVETHPFCDDITSAAIYKLIVLGGGALWDENELYKLHFVQDSINSVTIPAATLYYLDITIEPSEAGMVDPDDIGYYESGETVDISLRTNSGYSFVKWSDSSDPENRSYVMPDQDATLTAVFQQGAATSSGTSDSDDGSGCFITNQK